MFERLWQRLWERAPRQLRFTRAGKVLVGIALAAGLAAINTGNNLLFLGLGLVLSAITVSGVLSEATLRVLSGSVGLPTQARAFETTHLPLRIRNGSGRMPAYAVEVLAEVRGPAFFKSAPAPYQLRIAPRGEASLLAELVPTARGRFRVPHLVAKTAYPFGFFEKSRRLHLHQELSFWCAPAAVDVSALVPNVLSRLGEAPLPRSGHGDDFFSLRPYRAGDDVRKVAWRRSARAGRPMVIETEAVSGLEVLLELNLRPGAPLPAVEYAIATLGSLAESLLGRGYRVGVRSAGTLVLPEAGARQRWEILIALAKLNASDPTPAPPLLARRTARVALVGEAGLPPAGSAVTVLEMPARSAA